jgi:hypothetical protein
MTELNIEVTLVPSAAGRLGRLISTLLAVRQQSKTFYRPSVDPDRVARNSTVPMALKRNGILLRKSAAYWTFGLTEKITQPRSVGPSGPALAGRRAHR